MLQNNIRFVSDCQYRFRFQKYQEIVIFSFTEMAGPGNKPNAFQRELRLIESLDDIRNPKDLFKAEEIS